MCNSLLVKFSRVPFSTTYYQALMSVASVYGDLIKDLTLAVSIFYLVGGSGSLWRFRYELPTVVFSCQIISIISPFLTGSLVVAKDAPELIFQSIPDSGLKRFLLQILAVCLFPITPIFLIVAHKKNQDNFNKVSGKIPAMKILERGKTIRSHLSKFLRMELSQEVYFQVAGQIVLLLFAMTKTPTTSSMAGMFRTTAVQGIPAEYVLAFSILWSLKSCVTLLLQSETLLKAYMPFMSMVMFSLFALWGAVKQVMVMVAFLVPSCGHFDLLTLWVYEKNKSWYIREKYTTGEYLEVYGSETQVKWFEIDRWSVDENGVRTPPPYTIFTLLSLKHSFMLFFCIIILHTGVLLFLKKTILKAKDEAGIPTINLIFYCIETTNFFMPLR